MEFDYEQDMEIDHNALDVEWLEQPSLALKYGRYVSQLRGEARRLEEKKKIIRSQLINKANEDPAGTTGKDKPNASDIEAYYRTQEKYKNIVDELLKAQDNLELAEIAFNEITYTRKKALEQLVTLHQQQYFAGPSVPRNLKEIMEKKRENSKKSISNKMRRRK